MDIQPISWYDYLFDVYFSFLHIMQPIQRENYVIGEMREGADESIYEWGGEYFYV